MSRKTLLFVVVLLVGVVAWGCGTSDDEDIKDQPQPTKDAGDSDVQLEDAQDGSAIDGNLPDVDVPDSGTLDSTTSDGDIPVICPSCDELLNWDTTSSNNSTYGEISTVNDWGDAYAHKMLDECPGWSIFEGHAGGTGDTLEITSCNDGLVLVWAYESFSAMQLSQGWTGTTNTQIAIGSSYQDFVQAYPDYDSDSTELDAYGYAFLTYDGGFAIFKDSMLTEIYVF